MAPAYVAAKRKTLGRTKMPNYTTANKASTRVDTPSRKKTMLPRSWTVRQVKKQCFHARGRSVKQKNNASTRVDSPSRHWTLFPHVWKLCYHSFCLARLTETSIENIFATTPNEKLDLKILDIYPRVASLFYPNGKNKSPKLFLFFEEEPGGFEEK